ncbi:hypothetical protein IJZ97_01370 [bacterium]|nr:hypothetical protein [bacterium]
MKKILALLILCMFCFNSAVLAEPLQGYIEESDEFRQMQEELFTGKIEHLDRKDIINMSVTQVIDSSFSMEGDEFFAQVTTDVYGDKGVIIPKGTLAHGKISQTGDPGKMGKQAWIELSFDYLVTPDGREIPIEGSMSTKLHPVAETSKIIAQDVGYTLAGGAVGGLMALNWLGWEAAIASQGYTLAGGAAIGSAVGLGMALIRKGKEVLIAPGDEIRVKINTSVPLPVYKEEALKQEELLYPGLEIFISDVKHEEDPFGEMNTITLTVTISNMSDKELSGFDMALVNDYNSVFRPSIFGDTKMMFKTIKSGEKVAGRVSFSVDNIHRDFWLTFYDRRNGKAITKISVDNAYRKMSNKAKKKNEKRRRKNQDFKKDTDLFDIE